MAVCAFVGSIDVYDSNIYFKLRKALNEIVSESDSVDFLFHAHVFLRKNDAYSADGKVFKCYVGNSPINKFDMFLAIYADPEMTDLICQTGLVSPGSAFETLELDRALEPGDHTVYIAYTQMEDPKTLHAQTLHTMDFHVKE